MFIERPGDKALVVNPAQVRYLAPLTGGKTRIWFDTEHHIDVRESITGLIGD